MPWPCNSFTAARALVGDSKSTNPYPLHLLVALSRIALVEMIGPNLGEKKRFKKMIMMSAAYF